MFRSNSAELGEFETIEDPEHISQVWNEIERSLPKYWDSYVQSLHANQTMARLAAHFGSNHEPPSDAAILARAFTEAIQQYTREAEKYRDFFHTDAMEEFSDDPNAFKPLLAREVPVISGTLNQRSEALQEWQKHFRMSRSKDLFVVFFNIMDFKDEWVSTQAESTYSLHNDPRAFGLDPLDEDETLMITNVIGKGIKGIILYYMDSRVFPQRARNGVYGLYFLSQMEHFGLKSGSSEFLMIDDENPLPNGSYIMEHNYFYPFGLYSLYAIRIFRWLEDRMREMGSTLDTQYRYVYVSTFLNHVCANHAEDIRVMRVHDRFGIPA